MVFSTIKENFFLSKKAILPIHKRYLAVSKNHNLQFFIQKDQDMQTWSLQQFEEEMEITYLSHLFFEEENVLRWMQHKCQKALDIGVIDEKQVWHGAYFVKEIHEGSLAPIYLKWIDPIMEWGLFAKEDIAAGAYIGEYTGCVKKYQKSVDDKNAYCFEYSIGGVKSTPYTIDAKERGNLTRFINHSFSFNLQQIPVFLDGIMHVVFRTNQAVAKDEQLTYNYGTHYWKKREKPI